MTAGQERGVKLPPGRVEPAGGRAARLEGWGESPSPTPPSPYGRTLMKTKYVEEDGEPSKPVSPMALTRQK
jgi:hypothetical protein